MVQNEIEILCESGSVASSSLTVMIYFYLLLVSYHVFVNKCLSCVLHFEYFLKTKCASHWFFNTVLLLYSSQRDVFFICTCRFISHRRLKIEVFFISLLSCCQPLIVGQCPQFAPTPHTHTPPPKLSILKCCSRALTGCVLTCTINLGNLKIVHWREFHWISTAEFVVK